MFRKSLPVVLWMLLVSVPLSAAGLHYLGEIAHGSTAKFAHAKIIPQADGNLVVEGVDDDRKHWNATLLMLGGVGFTDVWQADFDGNGRPDLLLAAYFPQNGRCVDGITLSFLLFDAHGRPVPWVVQTRM